MTCITWKRFEGASYGSPLTVPLPDFRVNEKMIHLELMRDLSVTSFF